VDDIAQAAGYASAGNSRDAAISGIKGVTATWAGLTAAGAYLLVASNPIGWVGTGLGIGVSYGTKKILDWSLSGKYDPRYNKDILAAKTTPEKIDAILKKKQSMSKEEWRNYKFLEKLKRQALNHGDTFFWEDGVEVVVHKSFYPDGKIKKIYTKKVGTNLLHGKCFTWHANGNKSFESGYRHGKKHGINKTWYKSGKKWYVKHFQNGKEHGRNIHWHEDGRIRWDRLWKNNHVVENYKK